MLLITGIFILVVLPLVLYYGHYQFYRTVEKEVHQIFNASGKKEFPITKKDLHGLPKALRTYLLKIGILGACKDCHVAFKQSGRIRTGQGKKWINFTATQYMTANSPNFIWSAKAFPFFIRDKSSNGEGEVKVSLFGLMTIARSIGKKTDESALSRCLGELLVYPVGLLSNNISWEVLPDGSLKAVTHVNKTKVEGIFYFNDEGLPNRFRTKRYMGESLESFTGMAEEYRWMAGMLIPSKMKAIWNLKEGDFEYFNCTITDYKID
ncbi:DUF6544 family protein [Maribacter sp. 2210JD10-5]|uniref:DUF6544 family protein n=1 Tax=Maribacter sp. 2210JD10-5 TaxID=3386272 RepID=UPI0039BC43A2